MNVFQFVRRSTDYIHLKLFKIIKLQEKRRKKIEA